MFPAATTLCLVELAVDLARSASCVGLASRGGLPFFSRIAP